MFPCAPGNYIAKRRLCHLVPSPVSTQLYPLGPNSVKSPNAQQTSNGGSNVSIYIIIRLMFAV